MYFNREHYFSKIYLVYFALDAVLGARENLINARCRCGLRGVFLGSLWTQVENCITYTS
jgi:hypothetical protein